MSDFVSSRRYYCFRPAAVLKVTGEDAFPFLQGQFTQDLRAAAGEARVAYGLWLNQKGKVLADSFVLHHAGGWRVIGLFSLAAVIRERLEPYVIADDVVIEDETERWAGISVVGGQAAEFFRGKVSGGLPADGSFGADEDGFLFPGRRTSEPNAEWLYPIGTDRRLEALRAIGAVELDFAAMERLRIDAAIPAVPRDIGPADLPNEGGLERDGISYTKGCYLGQEVMARLKTMGQVRRRLRRVAGPVPPPADMPAALFLEGKKVGELRSAVQTEEGFVGLAMIALPGVTERRFLSFSSDNSGNIVITDALA
jgi:hypothetical protein